MILKSAKSYLLKKNINNINLYLLRLSITIILFSQLFNLLEYRTRADEELSTLKALSYECSQARTIKTCTSALQKIEEYQILNGFNENYSCQTILLGLQSKLIMSMLKMRRSTSYADNLLAMDIACTTARSK